MLAQNDMTGNVPVETWEVGAELLEILSTGLYSDAKDAIREYAQNGIDASATTVTVNVEGPHVAIHDDGDGMDKDTLRRARRFGMSDKTSRYFVGYRGIGIYAAFGMCDVLTIATKQAGMSELASLRFDFGQMRRVLDQDRAATQREELPLADVLSRNTFFEDRPFPVERAEEHFTLVTLDGVSAEYRAQLSDSSALISYLLRTLPIAFPDEGYGREINRWMSDVAHVRPVKVVLRVGNEPENVLSPGIVPQVKSPEFHCVETADGTTIALLWHALTKTGSRLALLEREDESSGAGGFLLRVKGFTLGSRLTLKPLWPSTGARALYHHYTGEVHVLPEANVFPNAARDDLEPSEDKQRLSNRLEEYFYSLNRSADLERTAMGLRRRLSGLQEVFADFEGRLGLDREDRYALYRQSKNNLEDLEKVERDLDRLIPKRRGRRRFEPTPEQLQNLQEMRRQLTETKRLARRLDNAVENLTKAQPEPERQVAVRERPPEAVLLDRAAEAVSAFNRDHPSPVVEHALREVQTASEVRVIRRAVAALDSLKSTKIVLSGAVELSRQELRTALGWSPTGPVSLREALTDVGFEPSTDREESLIDALDSGLLQGLGGRGSRYEEAIRSIAESIAEDGTLL